MTIDQIITRAKDYYSYLNMESGSQKTYTTFLKREIGKQELTPEEISYYADKLIMYSILTRQTQILTKQGMKTLAEFADLKYLKRQISVSAWDDPQLGSLAGRRNSISRLFPSYTQLIDEVGQHKDVSRLWGQPISYEQHIAGRKIRKARDRTTSHGFKRRLS